MAFGSRMDGCGNFMKYGLFIINLIIFIGAVVIVGLTIWTIVDKSFANELLGTNLYSGAIYVLLITGILISLVSCFGCFGAIKEVRCMLMTYFIVIFIVFVTMLLGGILGYVFREKVGITMRNAMVSSIPSYGRVKSVTNAWDETQHRLQCCGIYSYRDWQNNIPDSCCKEPVEGKRQRCQLMFEQQNSFTLYQRGCLNVTVDFVKDHAAVIGGAGIGVACLMIVGMIFSIALFKLIE
ncbi:CD151 antigen [Agrilus planipennis]|uniref:Tetraspanin n=1 Tax=Agrilus planipennis TaxID=224129 RepID=A0A1W4WSA2_AGRPL|nr:CD151 antigen [Agrilus planipennis]